MIVSVLVSTLLTAVALMLAFPQTPAARTIRRVLVEAPARFLADLTRARLGEMLLVGAAFLVIGLVAPEMMLVLASMGADAALLELMLVVWLASASGSIGSAWRTTKRLGAGIAQLSRRIVGTRSRPRARRRAKIPRRGRKGDQEGPGWAFA